MLLQVVLGLSIVTVGVCEQSSSVSKDLLDEHSDNNVCHWRSHVSISLERGDGSLQNIDRIPWSIVCQTLPQNCTEVDGILTPSPIYQNLTVSGDGWYGRDSLHKNESGQLALFMTKEDPSDFMSPISIHGCSGTMDPNDIPDIPWIALIQRGDCKFSTKIKNAANHHAKAVIVYTTESEIVTMDHGEQNMATVMIGQKIGENMGGLYQMMRMLTSWNTTSYTGRVIVNITYVEETCTLPEKERGPRQLSVTIVAIVFVVMMIIALAWLVAYYIQRHRSTTKHIALNNRLQKAAKKVLRRLGERVIQPDDEEADPTYQQDCTYCLESFCVGEVIRELPCRHKFHKDCVDEWLIQNRTCPNCKDNLLLAMGVTVRGVNLNPPPAEELNAVEIHDLSSEGGRLLSEEDQPSGSEAAASSSQYFGSQVLPGSQLLTDGQNMFLYVPNNVNLDLASTIQIETTTPASPPSADQLAMTRETEENAEGDDDDLQLVSSSHQLSNQNRHL